MKTILILSYHPTAIHTVKSKFRGRIVTWYLEGLITQLLRLCMIERVLVHA